MGELYEQEVKVTTPLKKQLDFFGVVFFDENSMNSHEPRVGTGTTGPGEAVFAIRRLKL